MSLDLGHRAVEESLIVHPAINSLSIALLTLDSSNAIVGINKIVASSCEVKHSNTEVQ